MSSGSIASLHAEFRAPPGDYGPRPLWFWNGSMSASEIERQIDEMMDKGVTGAYIYAWARMRPQFLTEEWWALIGVALEKARAVGFGVYVCDERSWPAGEVRDYRLAGLPSRVLLEEPELRMRSLYPERLTGAAGAVHALGTEELAFAVEAWRDADGALAPDSLRDVTGEVQRTGAWTASRDGAELHLFRLREATGMDGGLVDLMNPAATRKFIELVHEEYAERFGSYMGDTLRGMHSDHEGDYGYRLAWTPGMREQFQERKGYDLVPMLPFLLEELGRDVPRVRCDYLDVVSSLYADGFFAQLANWGRKHGLEYSGHVWEESLHAAAAFVGSHFSVQRAFGHPGVDSLFDWGRSPRHFKEAASVAHARRLPLEVEYQELQGAGGALSPEYAKQTTNTIAAWGGGIFSPGCFYAVEAASDFPEQGFEGQPWWRFYRPYADYVARLALMNRRGVHDCQIALYYPIETAWANAGVCFRDDDWNYELGSVDDHGVTFVWNNVLDRLNELYGQVIERLPRAQRDLDVVDAEALAEAEIGNGRLGVGDESFSILLLPPMTCMRRSAAERVRQFADAGGLVVAIRPLPTDSMEAGAGDPELAAILAATDLVAVDDVDELLAVLDARVAPDVEVLSGADPDMYCTHRHHGDGDAFFIVNDSDDRRTPRLRFRCSGTPERWCPNDGSAEPIEHTRDGDSCDLTLPLEPWQACFVVFGPDDTAGVPAVPVAATTEVALPGPWTLEPEEPVAVPYARGRDGSDGNWRLPDLDDRDWEREWLSPERFTLRDWWVIGPFEYGSGASFDELLGPETNLDLDTTHAGKHGPVSWWRWTSPTRLVNLDHAFDLPSQREIGRNVTCFAQTWVHMPAATTAELRVTADTNASAFVNGERVLGLRDETSHYLEFHDGYADRATVELRGGWNSLVLKVSQTSRFAGQYAFVARFCDPRGLPLEGLRSAPTPDIPPAGGKARPRPRWYRIDVPPATSGVRLAGLGTTDTASLNAFLDGEPLALDEEGHASFAPGTDQLLAVRLDDGAELADVPVFDPGRGQVPLGSLTRTGLAYHSGCFSYETEFQLEQEDLEHGLRLDLGRVGVACEAWCNDQPVGVRIWRPYHFDLREAAEVGTNRLRVLVANTRSHKRASAPPLHYFGRPVGGPELLEQLDENGLLGPVRLLRDRPR